MRKEKPRPSYRRKLVAFLLLIFHAPSLVGGFSFSPIRPSQSHHNTFDFFRIQKQGRASATPLFTSRTSLAATIVESHPESRLSATTGNNANEKSKNPQSKQKSNHNKKHSQHTNNSYNYNNTHKNSKKLSKSKTKFLVKSMFRQAKTLERQGQWRQACQKFNQILELDPYDAHSHLGLARLQARREHKKYRLLTTQQQQQKQQQQQDQRLQQEQQKRQQKQQLDRDKSKEVIKTPDNAREAFERGTSLCPASVHLWQAWAVYEESHGNLDLARDLFERALELDATNPYVCHAYGLMEKNRRKFDHAQELWERALTETSTAALVCSLGELFIAQKSYQQARDLYKQHLPQLTSAKDKTEVYLAMAWLEERYHENYDRAHELIQLALDHFPSSSIAHVALARLEGRRRKQMPHGDRIEEKKALVRRLANACIHLEQQQQKQQQDTTHDIDSGKNSNKKQTQPRKQERQKTSPHDDGGRVYNAWAHLEVKDRRYGKARRILAKGMERYPRDPMLLQAAGNVEERVGNFTGARDFYSRSLAIEPTAPTLVAYALLELKQPSKDPNSIATTDVDSSQNYTTTYNYVKGLFEEALLLDPRHGPAYNAYGTAELRHGTIEEARRIFERGVNAKCADAASIYHGYAKLELSLGNVDDARRRLQQGIQEAQLHDVGMDSQHRERALFLSHTLGMMELDGNRPTEALEIFQEGLDRYGNSSQLLLGAGLCEVKLGKQDSARKLFERSVLSDHKHAQAWQVWGVMEMRAGNISTARELFECGIKSTPNHGALWHAYASMESRMGETDKARSLFLSGIRKAPRHVPLYQAWASLELRQENVTAAKRLLTKALTLDKHNGPGWLIAANIEKQLGNDGLVGLLLRRGIECAPRYAELYRALGEHLVSRGNFDNAREIFEKGIDVNPLHAPTYHSLAELEARVFNVEGLAKLNRRAAEIFSSDATSPTPSSTQAWGARFRTRKSSEIPKGVAALAEKIVEEEEAGAAASAFEADDNDEMDPFSAMTSMSTSLIEDELVGDLLQSKETTETQ